MPAAGSSCEPTIPAAWERANRFGSYAILKWAKSHSFTSSMMSARARAAARMPATLDGASGAIGIPAVARGMVERRRGSIINIASMMAYGTIAQLTPYAASKGGLVQMTRNMALELARFDVRVNAMAPGYIETEMTKEFFQTPPGQKVVSGIPTRRLGQVEDLDGPLLLLASDASRYMNGSVVLIDGGFLLA